MNPSAVKTDPSFLHAPADWNQEAARAAANDGLDLEEVGWEVIGALQSFFANDERANFRESHDALEEGFHAAGGLKHLYEKLPGGPELPPGRT
jgi:tRNA 2-thiouridine synthesizing protein E